MKTQAIVLAAGTGERMQTAEDKPFLELKSKPLFVHCLVTLQLCKSVESVVLVGEESRLNDLEWHIEKYGLNKVIKVIAGGARRCDSVANGLKALDEDTDCVVIHDSARPLVSMDTIEDCIEQCKESKAVIAGVKVTSTIKRVHSGSKIVDKTIDRSMLWEIQTPQVFDKNLIIKAHQLNKDDTPTDDAALVERLGADVKVLEGSYTNIKVTTYEDLKIARALLT